MIIAPWNNENPDLYNKPDSEECRGEKNQESCGRPSDQDKEVAFQNIFFYLLNTLGRDDS